MIAGKNNGLNKLTKTLIHSFLLLLSICCIVPFILVLSISLSNDLDLLKNGYSLFPRVFSSKAYEYIFHTPGQVVRSYFISILITVVGSGLGMWCCATLAYTMSRKDYQYRRKINFYVFFTMLFNGGLVPYYILIKNFLDLGNSLWALILPYLVVPWFVFLMKGFLESIPMAIIESAKIDGAGEFYIFVRIILPLSKSGLATVGLFYALMYWNDWWLSLLFIDNQNTISLQYMLYKMMSNVEYLTSSVASKSGNIKAAEIPTLSVRMAMCILAAGPMLFVFPFFQKYFVKGLTVGSVKG